jgi:Transposase domain (DUF772)
MLLVGYCYGIRSERRLCEEVHLNLAYRWFCRLGLDGEVPDHFDWEAIARTRRSVREYLDTLDEAAWGGASETVPKFISRSDPAAQWTGAHTGHDWRPVSASKNSVPSG